MKSDGSVVVMYKKRGETPLEALDRLRTSDVCYKDSPLTYAGRLDPAAEGLLLVLAGEENKCRKTYLSYDKTYDVEILWGVSTDTGDMLGVPQHIKWPQCVPEMEKVLSTYVGVFEQNYPPFSSKKVGGKPLWRHAREGTLDTITIPSHIIEIYSLSHSSFVWMKKEDIYQSFLHLLDTVTGDFRQDHIRNMWSTVFEDGPETWCIQRVKVACSSGTYIRQLVEDFSSYISIPACVFQLTRTQIGTYTLR